MACPGIQFGRLSRDQLTSGWVSVAQPIWAQGADGALSTARFLPLAHPLPEGQDLVLCGSVKPWARHTECTRQMFVAFI